MTVPANVTRFLFEIIGRSEQLRVLEFSLEEAISAPFQCTVVIASEDHNVDIGQWIGQAAVLTLFDNKIPRVIHGEIENASHMETGRRFTRFQITLAPKFKWLEHRSGSRIFQEKSVPEIIRQVFNEANIQHSDYRLALNRSYSPRDYCVQYQETEFHFLSRLMEEEGIFYFFEHHVDHHVMVIGDDNSVFKAIEGEKAVQFHAKTAMRPDHTTIYEFESQQTLVPSQVTLGDYNFEKPKLTLRHSAEVGQPHSLARYQYPGAFEEAEQGKHYASVSLESQRLEECLFFGKCDHQWMSSGFLFELQKHDRADLNQTYLLTKVSHKGKQPRSLEEGAANEATEYSAQFSVIPPTTPYRPQHKHHKYLLEGAQTAFVTGPPGEEIYTDEFGRVKVQFHWDREGQYDEATSCWVRLSQAWAGKEWGAITLPRVGQEVMVHFIDGDPDRPLVTGRVYNGVDKPPYSLPEHKTRTTFKSLSYPGGGGYNELRLEDKKGNEQIYVHAEKDAELYIKNDYRELVQKDFHTTVKANQYTAIGSDSHTHIGKNLNQSIGKSHSQNIGKDLHLKVSGSLHTQAGKDIHIKAGTRIVIQSGVQLTLKGGAGFINLDPSGVTIQGPLVRINSGGSAGTAQSASPIGPQQPKPPETGEPGKAIQLKSPEAPHKAKPVGFDSGSAGEVKLTPLSVQPPVKTDSPGVSAIEPPEELETLDIRCLDADTGPACGLHYVAYLQDGSTRGGKLDKNGQARINNLPPGPVKVELGEPVDETEIKHLREKIQQSLDQIIADEQKEAAQIEADLKQKGLVGQYLEYEFAKARGGAKAIWGMLTGLKELSDLASPAVHLINAQKAAWEAYKYSEDKPFLDAFQQNLGDAEFKELADVIGFDPRSISKEQLAEAQALANFIWDDAETKSMLLAFAKDYVAAQHRLELTEAGAGAVTDIALDFLITALTLGTGAVIVVGSKLRHLNKFKPIGLWLKKLAKKLQQMFGFTRKKASTGETVEFELNKPVGQNVEGGSGGVSDTSTMKGENVSNISPLKQTGGGGYTASADELYDAIRASDSDVSAIASSTGFKPENIQKVKDHVFYNEHLLDRYVDQGIPATVGRFDSTVEQAQAWKRLESGTHTDADITWLKHETAERWYELKYNSGYSEAHDRVDWRWSGFPWEAE